MLGYFLVIIFFFNFFNIIFIGANQFRDCSLEDSLTDLIGFTESEIRENYMDILKFYCHEDYIETELRNIKDHYNGYKFNISELENRVYSPVSVIRHFMSCLSVYETTKQKKNSTNEGIYLL